MTPPGLLYLFMDLSSYWPFLLWFLIIVYIPGFNSLLTISLGLTSIINLSPSWPYIMVFYYYINIYSHEFYHSPNHLRGLILLFIFMNFIALTISTWSYFIHEFYRLDHLHMVLFYSWIFIASTISTWSYAIIYESFHPPDHTSWSYILTIHHGLISLFRFNNGLISLFMNLFTLLTIHHGLMSWPYIMVLYHCLDSWIYHPLDHTSWSFGC